MARWADESVSLYGRSGEKSVWNVFIRGMRCSGVVGPSGREGAKISFQDARTGIHETYMVENLSSMRL